MQDLIAAACVISTRVGHRREVPNATYRNHGGHAEAIEIIFDPPRSYRDLLDSSSRYSTRRSENRQGNDHGGELPSAIFSQRAQS